MASSDRDRHRAAIVAKLVNPRVVYKPEFLKHHTVFVSFKVRFFSL